MPSEKKTPAIHHSCHGFAKALPAFDKAMRKIAEVPKAEIDKRERSEREAKAAQK